MNRDHPHHHRKLTNEIPAWLYFAVFPAGIKQHDKIQEKWQMVLKIKRSLEEHLRMHGLENPRITEPNNHDVAFAYGGGEPAVVCYPVRVEHDKITEKLEAILEHD